MRAEVGLQPERTYLAWTRTGLAFAAVAALLIRRAVQGNGWLLLFGLAAATAAALILARAHWRYRMTVVRLRQGRSPASPGLIAAVAAVACVVSAGGLVAILAT
jgi:uncharacterized membrane protein YidH (DUF202 family)